MPRHRAGSVCSTPGCPNLTPCAAHTRKPWTGSHSRGFPASTRRRILQRDPQCPCGAPATEADHIVPVAHGGTHDETNGQGLCHDCHRTKTLTESHANRVRTVSHLP